MDVLLVNIITINNDNLKDVFIYVQQLNRVGSVHHKWI